MFYDVFFLFESEVYTKGVGIGKEPDGLKWFYNYLQVGREERRLEVAIWR